MGEKAPETNIATLFLEYKQKGNEALLADRVDEAIDWYSKALVSIHFFLLHVFRIKIQAIQ